MMDGSIERRDEPRAEGARTWSRPERSIRTHMTAWLAVIVPVAGFVGWLGATTLSAADNRYARADLVTLHIADYDESALTQAIDATDTRIALERLILRDLQRQHADDPSRLSAGAIEDSQRRLIKLEKRSDMLIGKRYGG